MNLYEVYLIRPDLRHEETIIQTANCFEYLNNVVNEVFDKIDARIDRNNGKIRSLNERTNAVQNKINSLVGINKAITIFSPAKYPGSAISGNVEATFSPEMKTTITMNTNYKVRSKPDPISQRSIENKLLFYHVNKSQDKSIMMKSSQPGPRPFPHYTESIGNLILFGDINNMYGRSSTQSKLRKQKVGEKNDEKSNSNTSKIDSIPLPVLNRKVITKKNNEHLFYMPNITNAPELDMPHQLPDLPGVADDIKFNISNIEDLLIVPSQSNKRDETIINQDPLTTVSSAPSKLIEPSKIEPPTKESIPVKTDNAAASASLPPPPPPPPPPPAPQTTSVIPPAPPAPPEINKKSAKNEIVKSSPLPKPRFEEENPHNTLMSAIRQAGGLGKAKLRATSIRPEKPVSLRPLNDCNFI